MAKVYTGRDGELVVAGSVVAKVVGFSFSADLETLETTTLGDNLRSYTPGVVGYSGSCTLLYYKESGNNTNVRDVISTLVKTGTAGVTATDTVQFTFRWKDAGDINEIKLDGYVTQASIGAQTAEISRAEVSFVATGQLLTVTV